MTLNNLMAVAGWLAAALILSSYGLVSNGRMDARSPLYQWMNLGGAIGFVINCSWNGAWPSVALNAAWGLISLYALLRHRRTAR